MLQVRCPICNTGTTWEGNPWRPFCSERCRLIDLDNWLAGRYRISSPRAGEDEPQKPEESHEVEGDNIEQGE